MASCAPIATFCGFWSSRAPGGSVAWGHAGNDDGQQRLVFPLLAEATPRPSWVRGLVMCALILALLSVAVLMAVSQLRPAAAGKLAVGPMERAAGRGNISVFDLEAGSCLQDYDAGTDVREVLVVPCDAEHRAEVVASRRMPEGAWPGWEGIDEFATQRCVPAIRAAGVRQAPALRWSYVGPSETSWAARDDRVVTCLVVSVGEPLTGSVLADPDNGTGRENGG
ncbi:MAG: septum formation family protein [Actinomycetota bacterium]